MLYIKINKIAKSKMMHPDKVDVSRSPSLVMYQWPSGYRQFFTIINNKARHSTWDEINSLWEYGTFPKMVSMSGKIIHEGGVIKSIDDLFDIVLPS